QSGAAEPQCGVRRPSRARKSPPGRRRLGLVPDALELFGDLMPDPLTSTLKRVDSIGPVSEADEVVWGDSAGSVLPSIGFRSAQRPCSPSWPGLRRSSS